jgi:phage-related protein
VADEDLGTGSVSITFDQGSADAGLDALADRIERSLDQAARDAGIRMQRQISAAIRRINPVEVEVVANTSGFGTSIRDLQDRFQDIEVQVVPEVDRTTFVAAVQTAIAGAEVTINVVPDLSGFDATIRSHPTPDLEVDVDADTDRLNRSLAGVGRALGKLGGLSKTVLSIGALGIAASGSAVAVAGLAAVLSQLGGIVAAYPAAILVFQTSLAALKLAVMGVGDAFSAALTGSAEDFTKSIEDLSPAARAVAQEVRALKPAFEDMRNLVQDAFFNELTGEVTKTARALEGPLSSGLRHIAEDWGEAAKNALGYIRGAQGVKNIQSILFASNEVVSHLALTTNKLTAGFLKAGAAVAEAFGGEFAGGLSNFLEDFGTKLQRMAEDGSLVRMVDNALTAFAKLGDVIGNIGDILGGVFSAANVSGGGFLTNLQKITQSFEDFVESAEGQTAIANIFRTLAAVASQLGPIFAALVTTVGEIAPAITPLLTAVGPAILGLIEAIGPLLAAVMPAVQVVVDGILTALNEISSSGALAALGEVVGSVLTALAPLLPVIGELATTIVTALAPAFIAVADAVTPVVRALADAFLPILPGLASIVLQIVEALAPFVDIIGRLLTLAIEAAAPLLITLSQALFTIADAVVPLVEQLLNAFLPVIDQIVPVIQRLVEAITPLIVALVDALLPVLPPLVDAFLAMFLALTPLIEPVVQLVEALAPLLVTVTNLLAPVLEFFANIIKWTAIEVITPIIEGIVAVLSGLITMAGDVVAGIDWLVTTTVGLFTNLGENVSNIVSGLVDSVSNWFTDMWNTAVQAAISMAVDVAKWFISMRDRVIQTTLQLISSVVSFFQGLPGKAASAASGLVSSLGGVIKSAASTFLAGVRQLISDTITQIRQLPSRVVAAASSFGSLLVGVGRDMIRGMIEGIKSMAGTVFNAVKDVAGGAVDGVKDFLGISSPSRVFREIGVDTGRGFVVGIDRMGRRVTQASESMAAAALAPFSGSRTPEFALSSGSVRPATALADPLGTLATNSFGSARSGAYNGSGATVTNNVTINEVGDGEVTAARVLNRIALAAAVV